MTSELAANRMLNVEQAVRNRYSQAAATTEPSLCCPVEYDQKHLEIIPQEILERDYGCGDPSRYVSAGEVVLDLGSGGGKICYIVAQIVGALGRVIGVDCNDVMLDLAKKFQPAVADRIGFDNVEFRKGKIQDLQLDLTKLNDYLVENPVESSSDFLRLEEHAQHLRKSAPLVSDNSVDVIVSNCVLNLVRLEDRIQLFNEMYRVLRPGGRVVISDIVSDEDIPEKLQNNAELWSGCLSGAFREDRLLEAFDSAGFHGMEILDRQGEPWARIEGIEFRSMTVRAFKGKEGPCLERNQAVVYHGPWKAVIDDDGHKLLRGQRTAVCDKTFQIFSRRPYSDQITPIEPYEVVPIEDAAPFSCNGTPFRKPRETKGESSGLTILPEGDCCGTSGCC